MLRSGEIADWFADGDARRGIQTAETQLKGFKRRMATKEKVNWCIQTSESEPMALKRRILTKKSVKGWFHNITGSLGRQMSFVKYKQASCWVCSEPFTRRLLYKISSIWARSICSPGNRVNGNGADIFEKV